MGDTQQEDPWFAKLEIIMWTYLHDGECLIDDVTAIFESKELSDADKVEIYKFLPHQLTMNHMIQVLRIEDANGKSDVAKQLRYPVLEMEFDRLEDKRTALYLIHKCLMEDKEQEGKWERESHQVLLHLLATYPNNASEVEVSPDWDLEQLATRAVLNHFKFAMRMGQDPESWQFDTICCLMPVRKLQTSKKEEHRLLFELLHNVFAEGKCSEYMSFYAKHKNLIDTTWELCNETLTSKIRILALCTLCADATEVSYKEIHESLCCKLEEVEKFVIEAMSLGLLNTKIDSISQKIVVKSAHLPLLSMEHWCSLREKLACWRESVETLLVTFDEVRQQQVKEDREADKLDFGNRK